MINILEIKNFKSIKHLKLDCRRVNIFIGEPNTGKSNILESLGLLSWIYSSRFGHVLKPFVRHDAASNLFYDHSISEPFEIFADDKNLIMGFRDGRFEGVYKFGNSRVEIAGGLREPIIVTSSTRDTPSIFKFYRFKVQEEFVQPHSEFLLPPDGSNLMSLLLVNKELRSLANQPFSAMGLRLGLRPHEHKIEVIKEYEDVIISHPYHLASDTLQRLIFYLAAIVTNKDSVLVFEEPEAHAFPGYIQHLAEIIGLDKNNNQYFISTHNPYFLLPVLEKSPKDEIAIFLTYYQDYQTKVKALREADLRKVTEMDLFSNLGMFVPTA